MGKKGLFSSLLKSLSKFSNEDKARNGKILNLIKKTIEENIGLKIKFRSFLLARLAAGSRIQ